ncbi:hypothetical protein YC2023_098742 [Brassica napus]
MAVLDLLFCSKGRSTDGAWRRYPLLHPGNTSVGLDIGMAVAVRRCGHVSEEKVLVYNVSTQHYVGATCPRLLFPASLEDLKSTFLSHQSKTKFMVTPPLIESDREKLLVMKT